MREKTETIIYFFICVLLLLAALFTGKSWAILSLAALLFYALLAAIAVWFGGKKLSFRLRANEEAEKNEKAQVRLTLQNKSLFPVFRCDMRLRIKNLLTGANFLQSVSSGVFSKQTKHVSMEAQDTCCGMLQMVLTDAFVKDPIGLFRRKVSETACECQVLILPELKQTPVAQQDIEHYDMESFRYASGKVGTDSSETVGLRSYAEGDSVRAIHWKLSAKAGEVLVKEYGYPIDTKVMLIADKTLASVKNRLTHTEALTEFALSISKYLSQEEISHTFGWYDANEARFFCRQVRSEADIIAFLPDFLKAPVCCEAANPAQRFLESEEEKRYSSFLYITDEEGKEDNGLERLREYGYVAVLTEKYTKED